MAGHVRAGFGDTNLALTGTVVKRDFAVRGGVALVTIVPSGSYATGGDTIDFTLLVGFTTKQPDVVMITGIAGFIYQYDSVNKKMFVYTNTAGGANAPLGEHTAAAYAAGVAADTIKALCWWFA